MRAYNRQMQLLWFGKDAVAGTEMTSGQWGEETTAH